MRGFRSNSFTSASSHTSGIVFPELQPTPSRSTDLTFQNDFYGNSALRFPLLSLPVELQRSVITHYFGGLYDITLENERLTMLRSRFHVIGMPPVEILLTSHYIYELAAPIRKRLFTGRLILNSVFILVPLRRQERFSWLREHTQILHFSDSSVHPERWSRYFDSLAALRKLEIDFPMTIVLDTDVVGEDGVKIDIDGLLEGQHDAILVKKIDRFRLALVDSLREGRLDVVIRQKFDLGQKVILDVTLKLSEHGAQVLSRKYVDASNERPVEQGVVRPAELVRANGNVIDAGSHRSIWEWYHAMTS